MNIQYLLEHTVQITSAPLKVFARTENGVPELLCNYSVDGRPAPEPPEPITQFVMEHCFSPLPEFPQHLHFSHYSVQPGSHSRRRESGIGIFPVRFLHYEN